MDWSVIEKHICSFCELLAELFKTFDNSCCVHFPFNEVRLQIIAPMQKTQDVETTAMR